MAKKTRKVLKQASQRRAIQQAAANVSTAMTAPLVKTVAEDMPQVAKPDTRPNDEYRYVKADLRRIGLLAGSFTAILIVLSFIIK
jgi:hypothetical protein